MQPFPIPQWRWEDITMNFVYKLPRTLNGYDGIWVVVDRLTKSVHFIPVYENYSLNQLAERFVSEMVSTAYHPQTDGQSESTIQTLEDMLRSSFLQFGDAWHKRLSLTEFAYNNSFHSSIGMAPFEALYGKPCCTPLCWSEVSERVLVGPKIVEETTQNIQVIKANLKAAQDRQKSITDRHSTDRVYKPLEINPYLTYDEVPVTILDWKDKILKNKTMRMVKVLWRNHSVEEVTWEIEKRMRDMYSRLFYGYDSS
ncbi:unnamed protein product [Malus baccata var. baccata]